MPEVFPYVPQTVGSTVRSRDSWSGVAFHIREGARGDRSPVRRWVRGELRAHMPDIGAGLERDNPRLVDETAAGFADVVGVWCRQVPVHPGHPQFPGRHLETQWLLRCGLFIARDRAVDPVAVDEDGGAAAGAGHLVSRQRENVPAPPGDPAWAVDHQVLA